MCRIGGCQNPGKTGIAAKSFDFELHRLVKPHTQTHIQTARLTAGEDRN